MVLPATSVPAATVSTAPSIPTTSVGIPGKACTNPAQHAGPHWHWPTDRRSVGHWLDLKISDLAPFARRLSGPRRAPHWQHDGDAAVTHDRTPVERSAHRAPSEARPSHVARAEQVGRGGPADRGAASRPPFRPPFGAAHVCWQRQATEERVAGAGGVIWGAMAGLSVGSTSV